jgi:hypothetical protein
MPEPAAIRAELTAMKLPNADKAYVDRTKITDYLLSESHPDGRAKARFFRKFGFDATHWKRSADTLLAVGISNDVASSVESAHGVRYTVDGRIQCPDGRTPLIRTVWIIDHGSSKPRLVTAHPLYHRENASRT